MIHTKPFFPSSRWLLRLEGEPDSVVVLVRTVDSFTVPSSWIAEGRTFGRAVTGETWEDWCRWMGVVSVEPDLEDPIMQRATRRGGS